MGNSLRPGKPSSLTIKVNSGDPSHQNVIDHFHHLSRNFPETSSLSFADILFLESVVVARIRGASGCPVQLLRLICTTAARCVALRLNALHKIRVETLSAFLSQTQRNAHP